MKKILIIFLLLFICGAVAAQEETLLGPGAITHGGYGGPLLKFTEINGETGILVGGRGGWIINETFVLGGGGYGLVNKIEGNMYVGGEKPNIEFGYGGVIFEYINNSRKLIHFSVSTLVGGGGHSLRDDNFFNDDDDSDVFFVAEPEVTVMLNVTRFFRIGLNAGYRFISGADDYNMENSDLSGFAGGITFKFGSFSGIRF